MGRREIRSTNSGEVIAQYTDQEGWSVEPRSANDVDQLWAELGQEIAKGEKPPRVMGDMMLGMNFMARIAVARGDVMIIFSDVRLRPLVKERGSHPTFGQLLLNLLLPKRFGLEDDETDRVASHDPGIMERRRLAQEGKLACAFNVHEPCSIPECGAHEGGNAKTWTLRDRAQIQNAR